MMLTMTACGGGQQVTYKPSKPYWLSEADFGNAVNPNAKEVCIYQATYTPAETPNENVTAQFGESTYKTELTATTYPAENGTACYLLTTTYEINGSYTAKANETDGEETIEFSDTTVGKTYFTWSNGITPIYSEQVAQSTLPVNRSAIKDENGNRFIQISCKTTITYGENDAATTFEIIGDETKYQPYFALPNGFQGNIKNYKSSNYVDSNTLAFFPRSFDFAEELYYSFSSIDVLSNTKHTMALSVSETTTAKLKNLKRNGQLTLGSKVISANGALGEGDEKYDYILTQSAYSLFIRITETYSGKSMTYKYLESTDYHHYMYEMQRTMPYNLGTLSYNLTEVIDK